MDINYDDITKNIPEELKRRGKWILWKFKRNPKAKKPAKIPYKEIGGKLIAQNDPKRSYRFGYALALARKHQCGIGLFMGSGIAGIDIDDIDDIDNLPDNIKKLINDFNSYTEISVSGKGLHIIVFSDQTFERKRHGKYELYTERRYFTITGNSINGDTVAKVNLRPFYKEYISDESISTGSNSGAGGWTGTDDEFVRFMGNNKLARYGLIWSGDSYTFENEFNGDNSAMDQALINYLVFYLGPDPERVERVARRSEWYADGAHQDKWERRDYLNRTITRAIRDHKGEYFDPDYGKEDIEDIEILKDKPKTIDIESIIAGIPNKSMPSLIDLYRASAPYPHKSYALGSVLTICSFLIGPFFKFMGIRANMMTEIVGSSGIGKNHALDFADSMVRAIYGEQAPIFDNIGSSEGLIKLCAKGEHPALLIIQDEAKNKHASTDSQAGKIEGTLRDLATRNRPLGFSIKVDTETKDKKDIIPYVVLCSAYTMEMHRQTVKSASVAEGNMNRRDYFLEPEKRGRGNINMVKFNEAPKELKKLEDRLTYFHKHLETVDTPAELTPTKRIKLAMEKDEKIIDDLYDELKEKNQVLRMQIIGRRKQNIKKMTLIAAVMDLENEEIFIDDRLTGLHVGLKHYEWAKKYALWQEEQAYKFLTENIGGDTPYHDAQITILRCLENLIFKDKKGLIKKYGTSCKDLIKAKIIPERALKQLSPIRELENTMYEKVMTGAENTHMLIRKIPNKCNKGPKVLTDSTYSGYVIIIQDYDIFSK